jgi:KDO2-lipid IV(A) lauroyltransferase
MYYLIYGFLYLLSLLPLRALYLISDAAAWLVWRVIGYRKEVVLANLDIAFPEKSKAEKERIAAAFYHNLIDTFIETIKLVSASEKFMKDHYVADVSLFHELKASGKKCQIHLGHNFNWELAGITMPLLLPYQVLSVYMPINNKALDRVFLKLRSRTGAIMLPATTIGRAIVPYRNQQYLSALVADQNPGVPSRAYWFQFFGRPTPFVKGPEKSAKGNDAAVVFAHFTKIKRGYYRGHFHIATTDPNQFQEGGLTSIYIKYLEGVIRENPEMWLWSHRRWKHEWKPEYGEILS